MHFSIPTLFTIFTTLTSVLAVPLPRGTSGAGIQLPGEDNLRIYYQDNNGWILEQSVGPPTSKPFETTVIFTSGTRKNTPLAAVGFLDGGKPNPINVRPSICAGEISLNS